MDIIPSGEVEKDGSLFFLVQLGTAVNETKNQLQSIRKDMAVRHFVIMATIENAEMVLNEVKMFIFSHPL